MQPRAQLFTTLTNNINLLRKKFDEIAQEYKKKEARGIQGVNDDGWANNASVNLSARLRSRLDLGNVVAESEDESFVFNRLEILESDIRAFIAKRPTPKTEVIAFWQYVQKTLPFPHEKVSAASAASSSSARPMTLSSAATMTSEFSSVSQTAPVAPSSSPANVVLPADVQKRIATWNGLTAKLASVRKYMDDAAPSREKIKEGEYKTQGRAPSFEQVNEFERVVTSVALGIRSPSGVATNEYSALYSAAQKSTPAEQNAYNAFNAELGAMKTSFIAFKQAGQDESGLYAHLDHVRSPWKRVVRRLVMTLLALLTAAGAGFAMVNFGGLGYLAGITAGTALGATVASVAALAVASPIAAMAISAAVVLGVILASAALVASVRRLASASAFTKRVMLGVLATVSAISAAAAAGFAMVNYGGLTYLAGVVAGTALAAPVAWVAALAATSPIAAMAVTASVFLGGVLLTAGVLAATALAVKAVARGVQSLFARDPLDGKKSTDSKPTRSQRGQGRHRRRDYVSDAGAPSSTADNVYTYSSPSSFGMPAVSQGFSASSVSSLISSAQDGSMTGASLPRPGSVSSYLVSGRPEGSSAPSTLKVAERLEGIDRMISDLPLSLSSAILLPPSSSSSVSSTSMMFSTFGDSSSLSAMSAPTAATTSPSASPSSPVNNTAALPPPVALFDVGLRANSASSSATPSGGTTTSSAALLSHSASSGEGKADNNHEGEQQQPLRSLSSSQRL